MTATAQARLALAGFAATLLTAFTLAPLIQGLGWFVATFVVVSLVTGVGASMRQVTGQPVLVAGAQLAMLAITLTALFARQTAVWGVLPGPAAMHTFGQLVSEGMDITRHDAPPVEGTRGLLLLAAGGIGAIGLLVDLIAVTLRRPAVAGLPLLAVYCVPAAVLPDGLPWVYFLLSGAGYLVLVGADAMDRVRAWGRVLSGSGDPDASLGGPLSGARRVAATCLMISMVGPALIPGLGERLIGHGSGTGAGSGNGTTINVVNPILNLRADLNARSDQPVIHYTTDVESPQPLRIVSDDEFTGSLWQPSTGSLPRSNTVQEGLPRAPGLGTQVRTTLHRTRVQVGSLAQTYLPLPYPTTQVAIDGRWLWDALTLNVVGEGVTTKDLTYTATFQTVQPTAAQLSDAAAPPAEVSRRYTKLPASLPASIRRIAQDVAGKGTAYSRAVKLQSWFRGGGGFVYSETLPGDPRGDSGQDAVASFLANRKGYCVQFASAMAVMARSLDIPARVAVGFLPGTRVGNVYQISLRDAHAWPELYFEGVGWVRFEPTPATRTGQPPAWTIPQSAQGSGPTASAQASTGPSTQPSTKARPDGGDRAAGTTATAAGPLAWLRSIPWRVVAGGLLALLLLATPRLAATAAGGRRWRRARTPAERAEAAWEDLRVRLQDLGVRWAASWTPRALQLRLVTERGFERPQQEAMARLVADLEQARYAPPGGPIRSVAELQSDVRTVVSAVVPTVSARTRRRARVVPASGVAAIAGLARNVDAAADQMSNRASELGSQVRHRVGAGSRGR